MTPTPRPALQAIALLLAVFLLTVPAVAETVVIDDSGYREAYGNYPSSTNSYDPARTLNIMIFNNIENCQNMRAFRAVGVQGTTPETAATTLFPEKSQSFPVKFKIGNEIVGDGVYGTFRVDNNLYIWVSFDQWDVGGYTGRKAVTIEKTGDRGTFPKAARLVGGGTWTPDAYHKIFLATHPDSEYAALFDYEVYYSDVFKNAYSITSDPNTGFTDIHISRYIDGKTYPSFLYLRTSEMLYSPGTVLETDDVSIRYITGAPIEVGIKSSGGAWYNKTFDGIDPGDPTDPPAGPFVLSLSPASVQVGETVTATLTSSAETPRYSEITYAVTDPSGNVEYETYSKSQDDWTAWQHYNKTTWQYDPSSETAAHNPTFTPTSAGTWTVTATIRDRQPPSTGEALASASATCEVSRAAGNVDVVISIYDGASSSTPLLYGVGVLVEDLTTNGTVLLDTREYRLDGWTGTTNGRVTVQAPLGHQIHVTAQKQGYVTRAQTEYVQPTAVPLNQMPVSIILSPATTPGPEQVYLTVLVTDLRSQPIQGASVIAAGKAGSTGAQGTCRLSVPQNQTISWTVRADGYHGASGIALPLDANSQMTVQLQPDVPATPGPGETPGGPGATPTPDHRTNEQKGQAVIDMIADNAEGIGALAMLGLIFGLLKLIAKW